MHIIGRVRDDGRLQKAKDDGSLPKGGTVLILAGRAKSPTVASGRDGSGTFDRRECIRRSRRRCLTSPADDLDPPVPTFSPCPALRYECRRAREGPRRGTRRQRRPEEKQETRNGKHNGPVIQGWRGWLNNLGFYCGDDNGFMAGLQRPLWLIQK